MYKASNTNDKDNDDDDNRCKYNCKLGELRCGTVIVAVNEGLLVLLVMAGVT